MREKAAQNLAIDNKMPSEAPQHGTQTEKPHHYMYLKEFRTQQCPLFLQHKCTQHRPFSCFHWHFLNQRRRRPIKKRDGTFNYSPDIYCTKYEEATGQCPDGDECPFLHRTAGDTERRYHLRYYKTGTCVYETDSRGHCVKNGPHCAFAHGATDLRPPVYDKNEGQGIDLLEKAPDTEPLSPGPGSLEKDKMLAEDPRWSDTNYVLANYKTEPCKRPPRLCRQGYACPQYHNMRDRRRSPKLIKYRSTPCPNVKHGDEWCDPSQCENGDGCVYCHTRTEQQFHPEIYKSTKCNDMVQTGNCPRGAFCAFAHVEQEMTSQRDVLSMTENSLAAFVTNALPSTTTLSSDSNSHSNSHSDKEQNGKSHGCNKLPDPIGKERTNSCSTFLSLGLSSLETYNKGRSGSVSSSISSDFGSSHSYHKAPGSEREDANVKLKQQLQTIENDPMLDNAEKARHKESLILQHARNTGGLAVSSRPLYSPVSHAPPCSLASALSTMSPHAPAFYPPGNTVESVVGKALDDLTMEDFDITSIDRELDRDREDSNSASSSLSAGLNSSSAFQGSGPIGIPPGPMQQRGSISSLSQSPPSPFGSLTHSNLSLQLHRDVAHDQSSSPLLSHSALGKYHSSHGYGDGSGVSSRIGGPQSPLYPHFNQHSTTSSSANNGTVNEMQRLREELNATRSKLAEWEGVYTQAKMACEAWRKEAEDSIKRAKTAEDDRVQAFKQRDEAIGQANRLRQESCCSSFLRCLNAKPELETLTVDQLQELKTQLQIDLNTLDKLIYRKLQRSMKS